jgi:hypothetical protein
LEKLGLHSLCKKRHYLDGLFSFFFVQVYHGLKSCTSLLENVSLCITPSNLRKLSLFCACPCNKQCPAQCACAPDVVGEDLDVFALGAVSPNYIYTPNILWFVIIVTYRLPLFTCSFVWVSALLYSLLQYFSVIYPWHYVLFVHNIVTYNYTVLCL